MEDLKSYYRGSLKNRLEALEAAREALASRYPEALESVRRIAHSLKGTGASYGFPEITRVAQDLLEAPDGAVASKTESLIETIRGVAFDSDQTAGIPKRVTVADDETAE